jgi:hypothetical protein
VEIVLAVVVVVIASAVVAWLLSRQGQIGAARQSPAEPESTPEEFDRLRPPYREFHVRGDDALVYFDVPLPASGADEVLEHLLVREAVEVLREKRSHDLPLDGVHRVRAFGRRDGVDVEVGSVELDEPGELPVIEAPPTGPRFSSAPFDPLAHLGEQEFKVQAGVEAGPTDKGLASLGDELELTASLEAGLRAQGVDPAHMGAGELALGLLRIAGYAISDTGKAGAHLARRAGTTTYLQIVDHAGDDYPELSEQAINEFVIGFAGSSANRGILVTEKFGPFLVYDKERREPRIKFITRERLQAFVDSFSMG